MVPAPNLGSVISHAAAVLPNARSVSNPRTRVTEDACRHGRYEALLCCHEFEAGGGWFHCGRAVAAFRLEKSIVRSVQWRRRER